MSDVSCNLMPIEEYLALLRSGKVVNLWASPGMKERTARDFWRYVRTGGNEGMRAVVLPFPKSPDADQKDHTREIA